MGKWKLWNNATYNQSPSPKSLNLYVSSSVLIHAPPPSYNSDGVRVPIISFYFFPAKYLPFLKFHHIFPLKNNFFWMKQENHCINTDGQTRWLKKIDFEIINVEQYCSHLHGLFK